MAVEIVGSEEAVKAYRKVLHERGTYTKRFQRDIEAGTMLPQPDDYRVASVNFKRLIRSKASNEGEDNTAEQPEEDMRIVGIANENAIDRMDERLEPGGVDIENFKKNPVLLVDHLYMTRAVVGRVENITPEDDGVKFVANLGNPNKVQLTQTQLEVRSLVEQGLLQTVSVGFIPLKIKAPEYDSEGRLLSVPVILQWELLELSIVAVPANAGSTFEMRNLAKRFAYMEDSKKETSHVSKQSDTKLLTEEAGTDNNSASNKTDIQKNAEGGLEGMDKLEELLIEMLGLMKAQAEGQAEILKKLSSKGDMSDEDEEEDDEKAPKMEDEEDEEEDDEEMKGLKKALADLQASAEANTKAISQIAEVVTELVNKEG